MACQKMANGFATAEELAGKAGVLVSHEGMLSLHVTLLGRVPLPLCVVKWQWHCKVPPTY